MLQEDEAEVGLSEDEAEVGLSEDEPEVDLSADEQEVGQDQGQGQGHVLEPAGPCRSIYI